MSTITSVLSLARLFPTNPSPIRLAVAAADAKQAAATSAPSSSSGSAAGASGGTDPATTTPDAAAAAEAARVLNIQNQNNGALGLVHTSLLGLKDFFQHLPQRKTLLGE